MAKREYGFDLTDFGETPHRFKKVLKENNIKQKPIRRCKKLGRGIKSCRYEWKNKGVKLITSNNPITGIHANKNREKEVGYASYMGIEGEDKKVEKLVRSIEKNATYIKDENKHEREFI